MSCSVAFAGHLVGKGVGQGSAKILFSVAEIRKLLWWWEKKSWSANSLKTGRLLLKDPTLKQNIIWNTKFIET